MRPPHRELLEYIGSSSKLQFSIHNGIAVNQGSTYLRMSMSENLKGFSLASKPFIKLGGIINSILPNEVSNSRAENLVLESSVEGQLSRIDEMRAVVVTEHPSVNYEVERKNEAKFEAQTLAQQNKYRWATLLALFCAIASILVALIGALQILLFVTFNYSLWTIPYAALAAIWEAVKPTDFFPWLLAGIAYLIANLVLLFVLLVITALLFKLPRRFFSLASNLSRNIYACPLPNARFDHFDNNVLRRLFENSWARKILEKKSRGFFLRVFKFFF